MHMVKPFNVPGIMWSKSLHQFRFLANILKKKRVSALPSQMEPNSRPPAFFLAQVQQYQSCTKALLQAFCLTPALRPGPRKAVPQTLFHYSGNSTFKQQFAPIRQNLWPVSLPWTQWCYFSILKARDQQIKYNSMGENTQKCRSQ